MLVIDGAKYELWIPPSEDEFEKIVKEHVQEIFGEKSIYIDLKPKLKSLSGIGSIPDGLAIICDDKPEWHLVELELSNHPLHEHIVSQVARFISGINNFNVQKRLTDIIFSEITNNGYSNVQFERLTKSTQTYKYIADLISNKPVVTIVIEEDTPELREAISTLSHPYIEIVEFKTYAREGVGLKVHAHMFEPIFPYQNRLLSPSFSTHSLNIRKPKNVEVSNLIQSGKLLIGQKIFGTYKNSRYEAIILPEGKIRLTHNDKEYSSLSTAAQDIIKHNINGWRWWKTAGQNGVEQILDKLRE